MSEQSSTAVDHLDSVRGDGGSNVTSIRLVGYDRPFFNAISLVAGLSALGFSFYVEMQEQRRVYFTQRCEAYVEQLAFERKPVAPEYLKSVCGPREK